MRVAPATPEAVREAAEIVRGGGLVVIPTETVYGLAANAYDAEAVARIFEAKGRPADNPLIVHLADSSWLERVTDDLNDCGRQLCERFWPGPLTIVVRRGDSIPPIVTARRSTVAIRVPQHPVTRSLIAEADVPLAAPSANRFMALSPTRVEDIDPEIAQRADLVLDGGPCPVGIESTVVDCLADPPRVLRPGGVPVREIEDALGRTIDRWSPGDDRRSPGLYTRHYSPRTPLKLVDALRPSDAGLTFGSPSNPRQIRMPDTPIEYAAGLFATLHALDMAGCETIYVERPPETVEWEAVNDRLRKATGSSDDA